MSEKKSIKTVCASCKEEFGFFKEAEGVPTIICPFCSTELKIEFEDNNEKDIYRSVKVNL